jgi:hypothetical protein
MFQDVVLFPPAGSQCQDHCALVTQSEMMENVQYVCHINDIFVTDFQTYDLNF